MTDDPDVRKDSRNGPKKTASPVLGPSTCPSFTVRFSQSTHGKRSLHCFDLPRFYNHVGGAHANSPKFSFCLPQRIMAEWQNMYLPPSE
ncbi:hypothetical protein RUM44_008321 [Polyplax serrata]|uniref:Uncharacterized protein n=1 Tax=Polyplax serrata TaxID=468196 RepID=A0ABR1B9S2_POLSC